MFKYIILACALVAMVAANEDAHAETKLYNSDVRADGFDYHWATSNGIQASRSGDVHGNMHGDYEYVSPEGVHVKMTYVANELGFQPSSDLLPTPPPIPPEILRSLEWLKAHPHKEEVH